MAFERGDEMNIITERILKVLSLKGLVSSSARIFRLNNQGLSGEVYCVESEAGDYILKFYRAGDSSKAVKEMRIYQYLSSLGVPVPKVYFADTNGEITRKPFLLVQKLNGESFSSLIKKGKGRIFVESLAKSLHKLHSIQVSDLNITLDRRPLEKEIEEIKVIAAFFLSFSMNLLSFRRVYKALSKISRIPAKKSTLALLHGDCGPDNTIYCNGTVYLIDLESAYLGDPAFDVGYAYHCIKLSASNRPELADHFIRTYESLHGKITNLEIYIRLAALKLAVFLKFLGNINLLLILLLGLRRAMNISTFRKQLNKFADYCIEYAEKNDC